MGYIDNRVSRSLIINIFPKRAPFRTKSFHPKCRVALEPSHIVSLKKLMLECWGPKKTFLAYCVNSPSLTVYIKAYLLIMDTVQGHAFQPPTLEDSRSPCPALNAAANHNYLYVDFSRHSRDFCDLIDLHRPHSGKNLGPLQLCKAVHDLYGLSYPLAAIFAFGGVLICGSKGKLDLADLAKAHKIEHDASLAHMDLADGDNKNVCPRLVNQLVAQSTDGHKLSLRDFAKARVLRESQVPRPLRADQAIVARGESVLSVMVMGDGQFLDCKAAREWFGDERLPSGWTPQRPMGLFRIIGEIRKFSRLMASVKQDDHDKDT
ncbi:peroxidase, family 2 domain-containing protein [Rhizoctonia solani AG-1 IA]|uniref:Peroxidase, family 2 domain-containing protein n=1 Tax=Thanatephorus cucumeris (strain AG1-IA) TaxID=983506 RepID=L8X2R3_THACA|nr:peroxidase, family 2 domain-containing protein [Rhizoctonia solani AG-1 IA]